MAATAWKLNWSKGIKSKWLRYFYVWQRFNVITGLTLWFAVMMQWWSIKVILFESVHASYLLSRVVTRPKNEHNPEAMMREAITQITALNAKPHLLFTISIFPVIKHNLGFKKTFASSWKNWLPVGCSISHCNAYLVYSGIIFSCGTRISL